MEEKLKDKVILVLGIFCLLFFISAVNSCNGSFRQKVARDKEMAARLALEEKTSKYAQDKSALEEKAKAKESQVEELTASLETTKKALIQDQLVNMSLKEELQKVTKLKETLEEELKQALINGKKNKK